MPKDTLGIKAKLKGVEQTPSSLADKIRNQLKSTDEGQVDMLGIRKKLQQIEADKQKTVADYEAGERGFFGNIGQKIIDATQGLKSIAKSGVSGTPTMANINMLGKIADSPFGRNFGAMVVEKGKAAKAMTKLGWEGLEKKMLDIEKTTGFQYRPSLGYYAPAGYAYHAAPITKTDEEYDEEIQAIRDRQKYLYTVAEHYNKQYEGLTQDATKQIKDVRSLGDFFDYIQFVLGSGVGSTVTGFNPNNFGAFGMMFDESQSGIINKIAERDGITPEEVIERDEEHSIQAFNIALANTALEYVGDIGVAGAIGKAVSKGTIRNGLRHTLYNAAKEGGKSEAKTEMMQTVNDIFGSSLAAGRGTVNSLMDVLRGWYEIMESGIQGFGTGFFLGGIGAAAGQTQIGGKTKFEKVRDRVVDRMNNIAEQEGRNTRLRVESNGDVVTVDKDGNILEKPETSTQAAKKSIDERIKEAEEKISSLDEAAKVTTGDADLDGTIESIFEDVTKGDLGKQVDELDVQAEPAYAYNGEPISKEDAQRMIAEGNIDGLAIQNDPNLEAELIRTAEELNAQQEQENAIQERETEAVDVEEQATPSEQVDGGVREQAETVQEEQQLSWEEEAKLKLQRELEQKERDKETEKKFKQRERDKSRRGRRGVVGMEGSARVENIDDAVAETFATGAKITFEGYKRFSGQKTDKVTGKKEKTELGGRENITKRKWFTRRDGMGMDQFAQILRENNPQFSGMSDNEIADAVVSYINRIGENPITYLRNRAEQQVAEGKLTSDEVIGDKQKAKAKEIEELSGEEERLRAEASAWGISPEEMKARMNELEMEDDFDIEYVNELLDQASMEGDVYEKWNMLNEEREVEEITEEDQKRIDKLNQEFQKERDKLNDLLNKFGKTDKAMTGVDPEQVKIASQIVVQAAKMGINRFEAFLEFVKKNIKDGHNWVKNNRDALRRAWDKAIADGTVRIGAERAYKASDFTTDLFAAPKKKADTSARELTAEEKKERSKVEARVRRGREEAEQRGKGWEVDMFGNVYRKERRGRKELTEDDLKKKSRGVVEKGLSEMEKWTGKRGVNKLTKLLKEKEITSEEATRVRNRIAEIRGRIEARGQTKKLNQLQGAEKIMEIAERESREGNPIDNIVTAAKDLDTIEQLYSQVKEDNAEIYSLDAKKTEAQKEAIAQRVEKNIGRLYSKARKLQDMVEGSSEISTKAKGIILSEIKETKKKIGNERVRLRDRVESRIFAIKEGERSFPLEMARLNGVIAQHQEASEKLMKARATVSSRLIKINDKSGKLAQELIEKKAELRDEIDYHDRRAYEANQKRKEAERSLNNIGIRMQEEIDRYFELRDRLEFPQMSDEEIDNLRKYGHRKGKDFVERQREEQIMREIKKADWQGEGEDFGVYYHPGQSIIGFDGSNMSEGGTTVVKPHEMPMSLYLQTIAGTFLDRNALESIEKMLDKMGEFADGKNVLFYVADDVKNTNGQSVSGVTIHDHISGRTTIAVHRDAFNNMASLTPSLDANLKVDPFDTYGSGVFLHELMHSFTIPFIRFIQVAEREGYQTGTELEQRAIEAIERSARLMDEATTAWYRAARLSTENQKNLSQSERLLVTAYRALKASSTLKVSDKRGRSIPYGLSMPSEFLSETFANPYFAQFLSAVRSSEKFGGQYSISGRVATIFDNVVRAMFDFMSKKIIPHILPLIESIGLSSATFKQKLFESFHQSVLRGALETANQIEQIITDKINAKGEEAQSFKHDVERSMLFMEKEDTMARNLANGLVSIHEKGTKLSYEEFKEKAAEAAKKSGVKISTSTLLEAYRMFVIDINKGKNKVITPLIGTPDAIENALANMDLALAKDELAEFIRVSMPESVNKVQRQMLGDILRLVQKVRSIASFESILDTAKKILSDAEFASQIDLATKNKAKLGRNTLPANDRDVWRSIKKMKINWIDDIDMLKEFNEIMKDVKNNVVALREWVADYNDRIGNAKREEIAKKQAQHLKRLEEDTAYAEREEAKRSKRELAQLKAKKAKLEEIRNLIDQINQNLKDNPIDPEETEIIDDINQLILAVDDINADTSITTINQYYSALNYLAQTGEMNQAGGEIVTYSQAQRRKSWFSDKYDKMGKPKINTGRGFLSKLRPAISQMKSASAFATHMARWNTPLANMIVEMFFQRLRSIDSDVHSQVMEYIQLISEHAKDQKLENMFEISFFARAFTTKTKKSDGPTIYFNEIAKNIENIEQSVQNKQKASEIGDYDRQSKKEVQLETEAWERVKAKINEHGFNPEMVLGAKSAKMYEILRYVMDAMVPLIKHTTNVYIGEEFVALQNYLPTQVVGKTMENRDEVLAGEKMIDDLLKMEHVEGLGGWQSGFTKARSGSKTVMYDNNIIDVVNKYVHQIAYDARAFKEVRILSKMTRDKEIRETFGKNLKIIIDKLRHSINVGRMNTRNYNGFVRFIEKAKNLYVVGRMGTHAQLATQLISTMPAIIMNNPKGFPAAMKIVMSNKVTVGGRTISLSDWFREYGGGIQSRDVTYEKWESNESFKQLTSKARRIEKISEQLSTMILRWSDKQAARLTWLSSFLEAGGQMDVKDADLHRSAISAAERKTDILQNVSNPRFAPEMFNPRSSSTRILTSMMFAFRSFAVNQSLNTISAMGNLQSAEARKIVVANLSNMFLYYMMAKGIGELWRDLWGNGKYETFEDFLAGELIPSLIGAGSDIIGGAGPSIADDLLVRPQINMIYSLATESNDKPLYEGQSPAGGYDFIFDVAKDLSDVTSESIQNDGKIDEKLGLILLNDMLMFLPWLPFRGDIAKIARYGVPENKNQLDLLQLERIEKNGGNSGRKSSARTSGARRSSGGRSQNRR